MKKVLLTVGLLSVSGYAFCEEMVATPVRDAIKERVQTKRAEVKKHVGAMRAKWKKLHAQWKAWGKQFDAAAKRLNDATLNELKAQKAILVAKTDALIAEKQAMIKKAKGKMQSMRTKVHDRIAHRIENMDVAS